MTRKQVIGKLYLCKKGQMAQLEEVKFEIAFYFNFNLSTCL